MIVYFLRMTLEGAGRPFVLLSVPARPHRKAHGGGGARPVASCRDEVRHEAIVDVSGIWGRPPHIGLHPDMRHGDLHEDPRPVASCRDEVATQI
jgi:hypothetical protein